MLRYFKDALRWILNHIIAKIIVGVIVTLILGGSISEKFKKLLLKLLQSILEAFSFSVPFWVILAAIGLTSLITKLAVKPLDLSMGVTQFQSKSSRF